MNGAQHKKENLLKRLGGIFLKYILEWQLESGKTMLQCQKTGHTWFEVYDA